MQFIRARRLSLLRGLLPNTDLMDGILVVLTGFEPVLVALASLNQGLPNQATHAAQPASTYMDSSGFPVPHNTDFKEHLENTVGLEPTTYTDEGGALTS